MTENLHTPLFVIGMAMLPACIARGWPSAAGAGVLLGLASLARSVSSAFMPLAALWLWRNSPERPGWWRAPLALIARRRSSRAALDPSHVVSGRAPDAGGDGSL